MAQTAKTEAEKVSNATRDVVDRTGDVAAELVRDALSTTEDMVGWSADATRRFVILPSRTALELLEVERELVSAWVNLAGEQMTHNAETLGQLAASRDWREAVEIQKAFVRDSLSRLAESVNRCLDRQGEMVANLLATGEGEMRKAA